VRRLGVLLLVLGVLPAWGAPAQETPPNENTPFERNAIIARFNTAITFYASFDGQPIADLSVGKGAPIGNFNILEWTGGKRHQSLRANSNAIIYDAAGNINFENAGALAVWVALGERVDSAAPVQLAFATIRYHGSSLALARQGGIKNDEALMAIVGSNTNDAKTRALVKNSSSKSWQPGEWHLLVVNWGSDYVELSLDGGLFVRNTVNFPLFNHTQENGTMSFAGSGGASSPYDFDELFIFNRPLSAAEAALIHESHS
jgi:hypothetical protein